MRVEGKKAFWEVVLENDLRSHFSFLPTGDGRALALKKNGINDPWRKFDKLDDKDAGILEQD